MEYAYAVLVVIWIFCASFLYPKFLEFKLRRFQRRSIIDGTQENELMSQVWKYGRDRTIDSLKAWMGAEYMNAKRALDSMGETIIGEETALPEGIKAYSPKTVAIMKLVENHPKYGQYVPALLEILGEGGLDGGFKPVAGPHGGQRPGNWR